MKGFLEYFKANRAVRDFLDEYSPRLRRMAVICLLGFVLFFGFSLINGQKNEPEMTSSDKSSSGGVSVDAELPIDGTIFVDIGGAVKSPMLAELPDGSRIDDAIKAAGGLKKEADMTNINRAEFLIDGQKVYIPSYALDEDGNIIDNSNASGTDPGASAEMGTQGGKVNINTADSEQLQTLNGIGPATAQKIIDYRESSGRFSSVEDIKNVSGIGDKTYDKLKDYITI